MNLAFLNTQIESLISTPQTALLAGIIAAFTPCTIALIPIFLYRFGIWGGKTTNKQSTSKVVKELGLLLLGYIVSFAAFGWILNGLFGSDFVNVVRLVLGTILVFFGVMQIGGQITFDFINRISNPIATGAAIPLIISFSPCVLPVITPLIAGGSANGGSVLRFILFGVGILIPAAVLALGGNRLVKYFRKSSQAIAQIEKFSALLIIVSGLYLAAQLINLTDREIYISAALILLIILYVGYLILRAPHRRTIRNFSMLVLIIIVWAGVSVYSQSQAIASESLHGDAFIYACSTITNHFTAETLSIALMYGGVATLIGLLYISKEKQGKLLRLRLS